jgi:uncharacterized protein
MIDMDKKAQLEAGLKEAMRSGDQLKKRTLRMVIASIRLAEIEKKTSIDNHVVLAILQKEVKARQEAIEETQKANRPELAQAAREEIEVLQAYLPKPLSDAELEALSQDAIREAQASSPADMGRVMKVLIPRLEGRASGDRASQTVRRLLQPPSE